MRPGLLGRPLAPGAGRPTPLFVGISIVVFAASLLLLISQSHEGRRGLDDAYVTYRYAENLAQGHGFVFNVGDPPSLGTSTPLYAGLLALGALLGMDVPFLSISIGILATSVALVLVVCLAREFRLLSAGLIVGLTASVAQLYWSWEGMETPLYLVLILGSLWAAYHSLGSLAVTLASLATIMRLEGVAVLVTVSLFLCSERKRSWRTWAPGAALLLSWLIMAMMLFGSPLPTSGLAKLTHESGISGRFSVASPSFVKQALPITTVISDFAFWNHPRRAAAFSWLLFIAPAACTVFLRPKRLGRMLTCWLAFYIAGYELLAVPDFSWYYGPPAIVLALFVWMALHAAVAFGANAIHWRGEVVAHCVTSIAAIVTVLTLLVSAPLNLRAQAIREHVQVQAGRWLRQHADSQDTVVAYEIGAVAYRSGLKTTDLLGLTEARARVYLRKRDFAWAIRELRPTYVFANERGSWPVTDAIFSLPEFALNYRPVVRLPFREYSDYVIYRRVDQERQPRRLHSSEEVHWLDVYYPSSIRRGVIASYSVTVRNLSTIAWRAQSSTAPVVTYQWLDERSQRSGFDQMRTALPCDVEPGQQVLVSAKVKAPDHAGTYGLRWELLREGDGDGAIAAVPAVVLVY